MYLNCITSQNALKFRMIETNHGTQFKIHFQSFPNVDHNISKTFCVILYAKYAFVHLNEICLLLLHLVEDKFVSMSFKNPPIDHKVTENFCGSLYTKYVCNINHLSWETRFCTPEWHVLFSLYSVHQKYVIMLFENPHISRNVPENF